MESHRKHECERGQLPQHSRSRFVHLRIHRAVRPRVLQARRAHYTDFIAYLSAIHGRRLLTPRLRVVDMDKHQQTLVFKVSMSVYRPLYRST
jgi:hypothetical protein